MENVVANAMREFDVYANDIKQQYGSKKDKESKMQVAFAEGILHATRGISVEMLRNMFK